MMTSLSKDAVTYYERRIVFIRRSHSSYREKKNFEKVIKKMSLRG